MPSPRIQSLKIKAKLLQKAKKRAGKSMPLKEAFEVIAKSAGYSSWRAMRTDLEQTEVLRPGQASAHWNTWYATYEEAHAHLVAHGGFLIPYQKHFFICDDHYIKDLGIEPTDADIEKVGRDWAKPANASAWTRLLKRLSAPKPSPR